MSKIAILSDTHDQIANLRAAIGYCNEVAITTVIHCGDLISPFMLEELGAFRGQVHLIYGNNAGDQHLISSRCGVDYSNITHHGVLGIITSGGLRIAFVHYPEMARGLATQTIYDIVCCGHNHQHGVECYGHTLLINPGHLHGEDEEAGFTVLDCTSKSTQRIRVGECMFRQPVPVIPEDITETHNFGGKKRSA